TSGERGSFLFSGGYYQQKSVFAADRTFPGSNRPVAYSASLGEITQGSTTAPAGTFFLSTTQRGQAVQNPSNDPRIASYNRLVTANPTASTFIRDISLPDCSPNTPYNCYRASRGATLQQDGGDGYNFQPENYLITPQQRI